MLGGILVGSLRKKGHFEDKYGEEFSEDGIGLHHIVGRQSSVDGNGSEAVSAESDQFVSTHTKGLSHALRVADNFKINDLVVDNRLTEGEIECILRMGIRRPKNV